MSTSPAGFAFSRINYMLLLGGIAVVITGYALMSGGGTPDPNVFNGEELFSPRRITVAPIVVLLGYALVGVAIMYKAPAQEQSPTPPARRKQA